ncbi:MAG: 6-phosphogluconolactonase [Pyrinomonadaceae bacterium]
MEIKIFQSIEDLNIFAAEKFIETGTSAIEKRGRFSVALAGGSTPKSLYQLLSSDKFKNKINWKSVFFFFGDERNVLPGNDESNFKMANKNLFQPLQIEDSNIIRWKTELADENKIADDYDKKLKEFFNLSENNFPEFDLILLGMGDDGHTASLFPFTGALDETDKIAVENFVEKLETRRYTLTFPAINKAKNIIFLVKGEDKAETLKKVLQGEFEPQKFPSQNVKPENGKLFWLVDESAARLLNKTDV